MALLGLSFLTVLFIYTPEVLLFVLRQSRFVSQAGLTLTAILPSQLSECICGWGEGAHLAQLLVLLCAMDTGGE